MGKRNPTPQQITTLPKIGYSRWSEHAPLLPFAKETARKKSEEGTFPPLIKFGCRMTCRSNVELHKWLANPHGYKAKK